MLVCVRVTGRRSQRAAAEHTLPSSIPWTDAVVEESSKSELADRLWSCRCGPRARVVASRATTLSAASQLVSGLACQASGPRLALPDRQQEASDTSFQLVLLQALALRPCSWVGSAGGQHVRARAGSDHHSVTSNPPSCCSNQISDRSASRRAQYDNPPKPDPGFSLPPSADCTDTRRERPEALAARVSSERP